ncbi:hypothetical protein [Sphingomonas sp.]|uniref:hypothetical protein n=1 Tax=Sphingomonas sp. TaxID=28214 RepID=UPI0035BBC921
METAEGFNRIEKKLWLSSQKQRLGDRAKVKGHRKVASNKGRLPICDRYNRLQGATDPG